MGAYENPAIIRDTSGQIYGQAIASFGQSIAKGISIYGQKVQEANKKAQEKIERQQRIAYDIEDKAYAQANKNYAELASKDPSLVDQFKKQTELLLRGDGENIGAIKAQTLLATQNDLTQEERQNYRNIVNKAQTFQISAIEGGGKILADLEDQKGILAQDIASTHAWVGNTELEKDTSMLTSYVLSGKTSDGLVGQKELIPSDNGSMIVKVISTVDKNSNLFKNLDEETKEFLKNNDYKLEWKKNINEWNEGLIDEIPEDIDYNNVSINNGFETKDGAISPQYIIGDETSVSELRYGNKVTQVKYIDIDGFVNSNSFRKDIKGKASNYLARGNGQLDSFMTYKMRDGSFNVNEFRKQTTPKQEEEVSNALIDSWKKTKLSGLEKRKATQQDVNNLKALGKNIKKGQEIYVEKIGKTQDLSSVELSEEQLALQEGLELATYLQTTTLPLFESIDDSMDLLKEIDKFTSVDISKEASFGENGKSVQIGSGKNKQNITSDMTQPQIKAAILRATGVKNNIISKIDFSDMGALNIIFEEELEKLARLKTSDDLDIEQYKVN